jgi:superfamily II DNA or RNA helicase
MTGRMAVLDGWLFLPIERIGGDNEVAVLQSKLRHQPRARQGEDPPPPVLLYNMDYSSTGFIGVPAAFGKHRYPTIPYTDRSVFGEPIQPITKWPNPNHPSVRNPTAQAQFMRGLIDAANGMGSFCAEAPTGSGKTVCALRMAGELGRKTLILVHLERLMDQWVKEIHDKLGVPMERIGIQQGERFDYEGKDFVVGMLQSLNRREYPDAFYDAFGTVIFDEVHKVGTQFFAPTCPMFPAKYKIGLTATMQRKDGGEKVFFWHLGGVQVRSGAEALPMRVQVLHYQNMQYRNPMKHSGSHTSTVMALRLDRNRNYMISKMIKRFWDHQRQALIVSESVEHLQTLMKMSMDLGVPLEAMGQYTGERHVIQPNGKKRKVKQRAEALSYVKENSPLIFATYGMIVEGIDIPRLDAGMDVTPRASATQLVGRIRRPMADKKHAVWVTICDDDCALARRYYKARVKDYLASNAEVVDGKVEDSANARGA